MEVRPSLENVDSRFQAYFRTLGLEDGDTVLLSGVRCRQEQLESTQVSHGPALGSVVDTDPDPELELGPGPYWPKMRDPDQNPR
jgi:hypothetical protein